MNAAHLHLIVNHFPIIGMLLAIPLMLLARTRFGGRGATAAAVLVIVIASLGSIASVLSGDEAHELLENVPGVDHHLIHNHAERAEMANIWAIVTGLAAITLFVMGLRGTKRAPLWIWVVTFVLLLITSGAMTWVGELGGHIRHPETFSTWTPPAGKHDMGERPGGFDRLKKLLGEPGESAENKLAKLREAVEHSRGEMRETMNDIQTAAEAAGDQSGELLDAVNKAIDQAEASGGDVNEAVQKAIKEAQKASGKVAR